MTEEQQTIHVPDFIVRQFGALQLQLAASQEEVRLLREQLAQQQPPPEPSE